VIVKPCDDVFGRGTEGYLRQGEVSAFLARRADGCTVLVPVYRAVRGGGGGGGGRREEEGGGDYRRGDQRLSPIDRTYSGVTKKEALATHRTNIP
jgi:hypothetical protein